jgi:hypothetical protein
VSETYAWESLRRFRQQVYDDLGLRQDSLFELLDAVLTVPHRSTLVRLSLSTAFRRRWPSTCDALADGSVDVGALRQLFARSLPDSVTVDVRQVWVIDGTNWPRPAARASADRTWEYRPLPGWPQSGIVPAWAYQWLVAVPEVAGSWVLPLDVQRRGPTAQSATQVALDQIAAVRVIQGAGTPRPVVTLDSGYDLETLAQTKVDADLLVRLIKSRVVYRVPEQHPGRGRPRLHGDPFRLADDQTHGQPQRAMHLDHPLYGTVQIDAWADLHVSGAPDAPFSVIRVQVERLPNKKLPPRPLWLAWIGGPLPADLSSLWHWYLRRFTVEHAFRFFKQTLGWTTVRPRSGQAADRWSWLIAAACWQLWLARPIVSEVHLPWEHPRPDGLVTPGQVHRRFTGILVRLSTPARAPRRRGKSPGRRIGQCPKPPPHYEVARRTPSRAA